MEYKFNKNIKSNVIYEFRDPPTYPDEIGRKIGRLTILYEIVIPQGNTEYWCKCECGVETIVPRARLLFGTTKSCGCLRSEKFNAHRNIPHKHGASSRKGNKGKKHRLYRIWCGMRYRCNNPKDKAYKNYGGRGITVCDEWNIDFTSFYKWAISHGYNKKLSIDRIDNNKGYSPDNCRWATDTEQRRNTRRNKYFIIDGEHYCMSQMMEKFNCSDREIIKMAINNQFKYESYSGDLFKDARKKQIAIHLPSE